MNPQGSEAMNLVLGLLAFGLIVAAMIVGLLANARAESRVHDRHVTIASPAAVAWLRRIHSAVVRTRPPPVRDLYDPIGTVTKNQWKRLGRAMGPYNPTFRD